jgi:xanthine dehydrogenase small subunit
VRGDPATIEVLRPRSVPAAVRAFAQRPDAIPLAGGTDFMVAWNLGLLNHRTVLDLSALAAWQTIEKRMRHLRIGALATHAQLVAHPLVRKEFPLLAEAAAMIGGVAIQNRGTLGGNIANASPAGDTFPPLAVYEALVHTVSPTGRRTLPFPDVFAGVKKTHLRPSELIAAIDLPIADPRPSRQLFRKVGTRAAQALSKTVAAGLLWRHKDGRVKELRFALGSMAPTVRRLSKVEAFVAGKKTGRDVVEEACRLLTDEVSPIDDVRSTAKYRLHVSCNILRSFLSE